MTPSVKTPIEDFAIGREHIVRETPASSDRPSILKPIEWTALALLTAFSAALVFALMMVTTHSVFGGSLSLLTRLDRLLIIVMAGELFLFWFALARLNITQSSFTSSLTIGLMLGFAAYWFEAGLTTTMCPGTVDPTEVPRMAPAACYPSAPEYRP